MFWLFKTAQIGNVQIWAIHRETEKERNIVREERSIVREKPFRSVSGISYLSSTLDEEGKVDSKARMWEGSFAPSLLADAGGLQPFFLAG